MADKRDDLFDFKRGFLLTTRLRTNPISFEMRPRQTSTGPATNSPSIPAFLYGAGGLTPESLTVFADLDFNDVATPWEQNWSSLCKGGGSFKPVMVETTALRQLGMGTVAAHRGSVGYESMVQYGSPTLDRNSGWLGGNGIVWVVDRNDDTLPAGKSLYGVPQTTYDVLTTMDGQVLAVLGAVDREALEDANWVIDLVVAPLVASVLVKLVAAGAARLCTAIIARMEARASPTCSPASPKTWPPTRAN